MAEHVLGHCGEAAAGGPCGRRTGHEGHHATIAARHLDEIARLRAALENAEKALRRTARHVGLLVQYDAVLPAVVCRARDVACEALNGGEPNGR